MQSRHGVPLPSLLDEIGPGVPGSDTSLGHPSAQPADGRESVPASHIVSALWPLINGKAEISRRIVCVTETPKGTSMKSVSQSVNEPSDRPSVDRPAGISLSVRLRMPFPVNTPILTPLSPPG